MTATEKRKYLFAKVLDLLAPYGYFMKYEAVWKYSSQGKYVICINCDLGRFGNLNELEISFGSFFAPIQRASYSKKRLFQGNLLPMDFYIRNVGMKSLLNVSLSFEEQVDAIIPFFKNTIFPLLPKNDSLSDYLYTAEQLQKMDTASFRGIPRGVEISETALAYLSLNRVDDAIRVVSEYAEQCHFASDYIANHVEIFRYDIERQVHNWEQRQQEALILKETIQREGRKAFDPEIMQREEMSREVCNQFFHLRK